MNDNLDTTSKKSLQEQARQVCDLVCDAQGSVWGGLENELFGRFCALVEYERGACAIETPMTTVRPRQGLEDTTFQHGRRVGVDDVRAAIAARKSPGIDP